MSAPRSIVIGGGAFAGLALALALAPGLVPISVIVAVRRWRKGQRDPRATAIVAACRGCSRLSGCGRGRGTGANPSSTWWSSIQTAGRDRPVSDVAGNVEPASPSGA